MKFAIVAAFLLVGTVTAQSGGINIIGNLGNINKAKSLAESLFKEVTNLYTGIANIVEEQGDGLGEEAKEALENVAKSVKSNFENDGSIKDLLNSITSSLQSAGEEVGPELKKVLDQIKSLVDKSIPKISNIVEQLITIVSKILGVPVDSLSKLGAGAEKAVTGAGKTGGNFLGGLLNGK